MGKKRRKAVYVPYDYETAYKNSLDKMEEANEERILKEGKVKSIYATKEIRSRMKGKGKGKGKHRRI